MITFVVTTSQDGAITALARHFDRVSDISLLCYGHDGIEAIKIVNKYQPNVVLMDLEMPLLNGIEATKIIAHRFPYTKIILLINQGNRQILRLAVEAGARGVILKNTTLGDIEQIIRLANRGFYELSPILNELDLSSSMLTSFNSTITLSNSENNDNSIILNKIEDLKQSVSLNREMMSKIVQKQKNNDKYSRLKNTSKDRYGYSQKYLIDLSYLGNDSFFITGFVFGVFCCAVAFFFL